MLWQPSVLRLSRGTACWCVPALVIVLVGCGGDDVQPESSGPAGESAGAAPADTGMEEANASDAGTPVSTGLVTNDSRTQWINDIPYDVFFDRPLDVVRDQTPVGTSPAESTGGSDPGTVPEPMTEDPMPDPMPSEGNELDWAQLVSAELLNEAVTDIRNRLTANLQTVAAYNSSWESIALDGHTLATLAAVLETHPDEVSWKENSKYVRDLGYEIWLHADGTGRSAYEPTQRAFENVVTILNGGPPPEMESDDLSSFADVIDRGIMMQQIEKTFNWLKADVNTATRLEEDADRVAREASTLAAFGGVMLTEDYDFATEPDYQSFAEEFVNGNREMVAAATSEVQDFQSFESGRNVVQNSCGVCHQKYRGSDSDF